MTREQWIEKHGFDDEDADRTFVVTVKTRDHKTNEMRRATSVHTDVCFSDLVHCGLMPDHMYEDVIIEVVDVKTNSIVQITCTAPLFEKLPF